MANNWSWKNREKTGLKKVVYALNEHNLATQIKAHIDRGWIVASEVKAHGNGVGILVQFPAK